MVFNSLFKSDRRQLATVISLWEKKIKFFEFKVKGHYSAAVLFQESRFDTKGGLCSFKKLPPFSLINVDLAEVLHSADKHNCH